MASEAKAVWDRRILYYRNPSLYWTRQFFTTGVHFCTGQEGSLLQESCTGQENSLLQESIIAIDKRILDSVILLDPSEP